MLIDFAALCCRPLITSAAKLFSIAIGSWMRWGLKLVTLNSGAGTNLKLGAHVRRKAPEFFFVVSLHFFGSASKIIRFGKRFRDGQYS